MNEREVLQVTDKTQVENRVGDESVWTKLSREGWVLGAGLVKGAKDGIEETIAEPGAAAGRLGMAFVVGSLLGAGQRTAGLARLGVEAVGVGMGLAFCRDFLQPRRWSDVRDALSGAWESSANTDRSVNLIGNQLGRFAFDTMLMSGAALGGAKFGQKFFADVATGFRTFDTGSHMSSYDRMILDKMNRTHPY